MLTKIHFLRDFDDFSKLNKFQIDLQNFLDNDSKIRIFAYCALSSHTRSFCNLGWDPELTQ